MNFCVHIIALWLVFLATCLADTPSYNKRVGAKFLEEVETRQGILKLKSGLLVEVIATQLLFEK